MQELKKQIEVLLVSYFREVSNQVPKGRLVASESPDFILKMKNSHRLGIELVRLNPPTAPEVQPENIARSALQDELIENARDLFEQHSDLKLFTKFRFSDSRTISEERILVVAVKLAAVIRSFTNPKKSNSFFFMVLQSEHLPEGVEEVLLVHHPGLKTSVWERANNLGIPRDVAGDIHAAIRKKEEKLGLYRQRKTEALWLLITTDLLRGLKNYHLPNKIAKENFVSKFDRVFLFDLMRARIIALI